MARIQQALWHTVTALGVTAVGLVGLASPSSATDVRHVVAAHVAGDKAVFSVKSTRPGWTHVLNSRAMPFAVLRGTGQGAATLASDYNRQHFGASQRDFPYTTTVDPSADAYVRLRPGRYFVVDALHRGTWTASQIGVLNVSGSTVDTPLPRATTIMLNKRSDIHAASTLHRLPYARLIDRSSQHIDIEAIRIDPSTPNAAVQRFVAHPSLTKVTTLTAHPVYTLAQTSAPTATIYNPEHLKPGREMLISFSTLNDRLHHGQARLVTVL